MSKKYEWTLRLSLLTIPFLFIVVWLMGGGHGTYVPAIVLFPFGLLSLPLLEKLAIPFVIIGVLQYPIYGFLIDRVIMANRKKWFISLIFFVHIILAITIIALTSNK